MSAATTKIIGSTLAPMAPMAPMALGVLLALGSGTACAEAAGEVEFSRGVGFAQLPGQGPRTLGRGLPLREGDRLTTSEGASAVVRLHDGTRMTVRPNSELVLQQYRFRQDATDNSLLMQLVRGGFRAVTGLIAKSSPDAARIQTRTATIGIRGTDFDARLCGADCSVEAQRSGAAARPGAILASARVVSSQGRVEAVDANDERRRLVDGASIYPGDVVETSAATQAILAFRDETRVTLGAATRFRIDNFVYDDRNAGDGRFLVSLLRGSVRALTGLIAKANNRNVGFATATATIGIRGTGLDMECLASCAGEGDQDGLGLSVWTWQGAVVVVPTGQPPLPPLTPGQGLLLRPTGTAPLDQPPRTEGPRPDTVDVPPQLFAREDVPETEHGLYVHVRDGHIEIISPQGNLHLGRGETGFAGPGRIVRTLDVPRVIDNDPTPHPLSSNPGLVSALFDAGIRPVNQCR